MSLHKFFAFLEKLVTLDILSAVGMAALRFFSFYLQLAELWPILSFKN